MWTVPRVVQVLSSRACIRALSRVLPATPPKEENVFRDIVLGSGDVMIILSSKEVIAVDNVATGKGSVFFIGHMSDELLQLVAESFEMTLTRTEYGVYSTILHPDPGKQLTCLCGITLA